MAHAHYPAVFLGLPENVLALLLRLGHRLFQKHVVPQFQGLHAGLVMAVVRGADSHRVGEFLSRGKNLAEVSETHFRGHTVLVRQSFGPVVQDVGDPHYLHCLGVSFGIGGIYVPAVSRADYYDAYLPGDIRFQPPYGNGVVLPLNGGFGFGTGR